MRQTDVINMKTVLNCTKTASLRDTSEADFATYLRHIGNDYVKKSLPFSIAQFI